MFCEFSPSSILKLCLCELVEAIEAEWELNISYILDLNLGGVKDDTMYKLNG